MYSHAFQSNPLYPLGTGRYVSTSGRVKSSKLIVMVGLAVGTGEGADEGAAQHSSKTLQESEAIVVGT
jgi:hypothetical protein